MLTKTARDHFGSDTKLARALSISPQAVAQWDSLVPPLRAHQLHQITAGALKFDSALYARSPRWRSLAEQLAGATR